jgi:hypothetical protein
MPMVLPRFLAPRDVESQTETNKHKNYRVNPVKRLGAHKHQYSHKQQADSDNKETEANQHDECQAKEQNGIDSFIYWVGKQHQYSYGDK